MDPWAHGSMGPSPWGPKAAGTHGPYQILEETYPILKETYQVLHGALIGPYKSTMAQKKSVLGLLDHF